MKTEIDAFEADIVAFRARLDQEGIWLFLGTLGCWSVPHGWLRTVSFIMALLFFFWRIWMKSDDKRPFAKRASDIEQKIGEKFGDSTEGKALLYDLGLIKRKYVERSNLSMKSGIVYVACTMHSIVSIAYDSYFA